MQFTAKQSLVLVQVECFHPPDVPGLTWLPENNDFFPAILIIGGVILVSVKPYRMDIVVLIVENCLDLFDSSWQLLRLVTLG